MMNNSIEIFKMNLKYEYFKELLIKKNVEKRIKINKNSKKVLPHSL